MVATRVLGSRPGLPLNMADQIVTLRTICILLSQGGHLWVVCYEY
jgi:hypothetical protein